MSGKPYGYPVFSCEEALAHERAFFAGQQEREWAAMERVGVLLAAGVLRDYEEIGGWPRAASVLVLAGRGHNGADALLAAAALRRAKPDLQVGVVACAPRASWRPLMVRAWEVLCGELGEAPLSVAVSDLASRAWTLVLDGVFGLGFRLPMDAPTSQVLAAVNAHAHVGMRVAVDLPSGLSEAGQSEVCFRADFTYATGVVKQPLLERACRREVGRVRLLELGFFEDSGATLAAHPRWLGRDVLAGLRAWRRVDVDKRDFGHLVVVAGSVGMPGAALMCVRAALRSGVGLVTVGAPEGVVRMLAGEVPEAMWVPLPQLPDGTLALQGRELIMERVQRASALLCGPGLGNQVQAHQLCAELVAGSVCPVLLDADALREEVVGAALARPLDAWPVVVTPHLGEFRRMLGRAEAGGEPEQVRAFARSRRVLTLLKGAPSCISDGESVFWMGYGGPVLARGGSGDVLAGLVAGRLAVAPEACLQGVLEGAVWHGLAADSLARASGQVAVVATDLLAHLPWVLREVPDGT